MELARHRNSYYPPSAADDLYALGVTAYRLVMGQYPPPMDTREDEEGYWHLIRPDPRPPLESNPRVGPRLREVILRLLSEAPEARGTAAQAATELEALAEERVSRLRAWRPWLAVAAVAGLAVLLWNVAPVSVQPQRVSASSPRASDFQSPDAGTSAVGDTSPPPEAGASPVRAGEEARCPAAASRATPWANPARQKRPVSGPQAGAHQRWLLGGVAPTGRRGVRGERWRALQRPVLRPCSRPSQAAAAHLEPARSALTETSRVTKPGR